MTLTSVLDAATVRPATSGRREAAVEVAKTLLDSIAARQDAPGLMAQRSTPADLVCSADSSVPEGIALVSGEQGIEPSLATPWSGQLAPVELPYLALRA